MKLLFKKYYSKLSLNTSALLDRAKMTEHTFMIVVAIIIGILAGFSAIGIRAMIKFFSQLSFPGPGNLLENIINTPWYLIIIIPVIGGIIVGPLIYYFAPEAKGHGVPEVMQAILLKGGQIRGRIAIIKAIASAITIGTGGSFGRERTNYTNWFESRFRSRTVSEGLPEKIKNTCWMRSCSWNCRCF